MEETASTTVPRIGTIMPDGTVFAGSSPDTGNAMFTTAEDANLSFTFDEAQKYAEELNEHKAGGHDDWRVPTSAELNVLFQNHAAIGGFNVSGSIPAGWYWSSSEHLSYDACGQSFSDGLQNYVLKNYDSSLRCVRG